MCFLPFFLLVLNSDSHWVGRRLFSVVSGSPAILWTVSHQAPLSMGLFSGKNSGASCHFLPQGLFPFWGWNLRLLWLLRCRQTLY